jgi:hypothetical protein
MSQTLWGSAEWRADAVAWLDDQLRGLGIVRTGDAEQPHLRPWATALRVPTSHGIVWLKAAGPGTAFEVGLYELLQRVAPHWVLEPLVVDVARGWLVLPDGGPVLGERAKEAGFLDDYADALAQYGVFQREVAPHVDALLARGVTDMRPALLPQRFEQALQVVQRYVERQGDDTDRRLFARLGPLREELVRGSADLAASPGFASLDHNDLHPWNIFAPPRAAGALECRFYDWGDSVIAHAFTSLHIPLSFMPEHLGIDPSDPRLTRVRDAYLEVFSDLAARDELIATARLACRVGVAARALVWQRAVNADPDETSELARMPFDTLTSLLDPNDP